MARQPAAYPAGGPDGATKEYRAEFERKRQPSQTRTGTMVGIDTYHTLIPSPEFARIAG